MTQPPIRHAEPCLPAGVSRYHVYMGLTGEPPSGHITRFGPPSAKAYERGCRCAECTAKNTEKGRINRAARKQRQLEAQRSEWAGESETPDDKPQSAERDCPDCGLPLYWNAPGLTTQVCENGHTQLPIAATQRAQNYGKRAKRESQALAPADMTNNRQFMLRQMQLARRCRKAATEFDTSEIDRITGKPFWNASGAEQLADMFTVLEKQANRASTEPELAELESAFNSVYHSQPASNVRGALQQTLNQALYSMRRMPERQNYIISIVGTDGRESGIKPGLAFDAAPGVSPRAINPPKGNARIIESEYGPEDYDDTTDEDYNETETAEDSDYLSIDSVSLSPSGFKVALVVAGIAAGFYVLFVWLPDKFDDYREQKEHTCAFSGRFRKCPRANNRLYGSFDGETPYSECEPVTVCDNHYSQGHNTISAFMGSVYDPAPQAWVLEAAI